MSTIFIDPSDGMLSVKDSYADKERCSSAGCYWDSENKLWKMIFTLSTLDTLLKKIPHAVYDPSMKKAIEDQKKKEDALIAIKKMSDENQDIPMRLDGMDATLFPYQKLGVLYATTNGKGVLIGDAPGLGKTLQGLTSAIIMKQKGLIQDCLIVTPASLKYNWPLEIEKFTKEKYIVIDGKKPEDRISKWLDKSAFFKIANYELIVEDLFGGRVYKEKEKETQEEKQKRLVRERKRSFKASVLADVKNHVWGMLITDESHYLKHTNSMRYKAIKSLKSKMKVFLTGTPMDGRLEELYSIMNILAPGLLGSRPHFFSRYVVTDFFGGIKGYKNINEVQRVIQPFFLRRLKKDVLKQLPEKTYENKVIELTPEERKIYDAIKKGKHPCVQKDGIPVEPMVRAIRCRQFCNFPQMLEKTCKSSTKLDVFKDLIEETVKLNGEKAIVFTQYKQMLNVIEQVIKDLGLKFLRIDGDTDKQLRADYQKVFNEDASIDCIIGTEAMSTGLNLTGASIVVNYDDNWQPAIMAQRVDRAHRYGQKNAVMCISFICKDTIEEKVRKILYAKDKLTSDVLGDGTDEAVLMKLGPREIEDLL